MINKVGVYLSLLLCFLIKMYPPKIVETLCICFDKLHKLTLTGELFETTNIIPINHLFWEQCFQNTSIIQHDVHESLFFYLIFFFNNRF